MEEGVEAEPFEWMEDCREQVYTPVRMKRKRSKQKEFVGWGSRDLIKFMNYIGKDTSEKISQHEVASIITNYVNKNKLYDPKKKKRIICDQWIHSIFGKKTISRSKIHNLLEEHFAENQDQSDGDLLFSSDEKENFCDTSEKERVIKPDRKTKTRELETLKSEFAAIVPENIKLVYLKSSLVEDLLKDPENFETKLVGSFVRIKSDPNDYLQKNPYQLVQVMGVKKIPRSNGSSPEILLHVSNVVKDVRIRMLSDDNFSEEECNDLLRRVKDGFLKRPTVAELQQKVDKLHVDTTKHWLAREIPLLQKLIDHNNEKGRRREVDQYLDKKLLLQNPDERSRLLREIPKVIAEETELETNSEEIPENEVDQENNGSPIRDEVSTREKSPENINQEITGSQWSPASETSEVAANETALVRKKTCKEGFAESPRNALTEEEPKKQPSPEYIQKSSIKTELVKNKANKVTTIPEIIDLSDSDDDEENKESSTGEKLPSEDLSTLIWNYMDPQGEVQGPFSLLLLKHWSDADYFPPNFKIWKMGEGQGQAVLLEDILHRNFSSPG